MSMSDPVADMLTRIRNAQLAEKAHVEIPHSKLKESIAEVLLEEGYILEFSVDEKRPGIRVLLVKLKYYASSPVIESIDRVSRPGLRVYRGVSELPKVMNGLGVSIISTSKGIMTDKKARSLNIGGEVLCTVA